MTVRFGGGGQPFPRQVAAFGSFPFDILGPRSKVSADTHYFAMSNRCSERRLPEEVLGFLSTLGLVPIISVPFASLLLSDTLYNTDLTKLFIAGLGAGFSGIVLLFFARLPLYRQRRFLMYGPRSLDKFHRRLYWLAYLTVLASIGLMAVVWFRLE